MKENASKSPSRALSASLPALFIALGIAAAGYFIGNTLYKPRIALNTASAKGLAEKRVTADRANWKVLYSVSAASKEEIPNLYLKAEAQQKVILATLLEGGLTKDEVKIGVISYSNKEYRDETQVLVDEKHDLTGSITVETNQVKLVDPLRAKINRLITQGIDISDYRPSYHFTKLNDVKPEMLKEASRNARIAAAEFAENAGVSVGKIRTASQGTFDVQDIGESGGATRRIEKNVRVVTKVEFYLID